MEQIVFNSQQEFENAVMIVLKYRLCIDVDHYNLVGQTDIILLDRYDDQHDYFSSTALCHSQLQQGE